jgi:hypothetical protein
MGMITISIKYLYIGNTFVKYNLFEFGGLGIEFKGYIKINMDKKRLD